MLQSFLQYMTNDISLNDFERVPDGGTWNTRVLSKRGAKQDLTAINISADDSCIA